MKNKSKAIVSWSIMPTIAESAWCTCPASIAGSIFVQEHEHCHFGTWQFFVCQHVSVVHSGTWLARTNCCAHEQKACASPHSHIECVCICMCIESVLVSICMFGHIFMCGCNLFVKQWYWHMRYMHVWMWNPAIPQSWLNMGDIPHATGRGLQCLCVL